MKIRRFVTVFLLSILFTIGLFLSDSSSTHAYETRVTGLEVKSTNNDALQPSNASSIVPIGYNFPIALNKGNEIQGKPGIAFDGSNFFAVWANLSNNNIYGARVSQAGVVLDPNAISISVSLNSLVRQPSVAFDGTNFFVAWCATRSGVLEVYGARVTTNGVVLDPQGIKLTTGSNALDRMPGIAFDGANYLIVWRTTSPTIRAARISKEGVNLDTPAGFAITTSGTSRYPAVAFDGENFMVVWHKTVALTGDDIYGARVTKNGVVLDPEGFLICDAAMNQNYPTIAFNGVNYLVVWHDWRPNADQSHGSAYGARVSPNGTVLDIPAFKIADQVRGQVPVQLVFDGIDWFVVYMEEKDIPANFRLTDVFGFRISADGQIINQQGIPVSTSFGHQFGPVVGYGNDRYLVSWADSFRTNAPAIYGQMLQRLNFLEPFSARELMPPDGFPSLAPESTDGAWIQENSMLSSYATAGVAFSADNSYAFGERQAAHYLDGQWYLETMFPEGYPFGSWASGPGDIWVTGWCGGFNHYNGQYWEDTGCFSGSGSHTTTAVWGSSPTDLWASADNGKLLKYDGVHNWATLSTGVQFDLTDLWGTSANNIYAVGERGTVLHYTGGSWNIVPLTATLQTLNAVWGSSANDIFAVGDWGAILHYDGKTWSLEDSGTNNHLFDVWGFGAANVYAVGFNGTILHYNGDFWQAESSGVNQKLLSVWGVVDLAAESQTLWASGYGSVILKQAIPITVYRSYLPTISR